MAIDIHDVIHVFWYGCGMGTNSIKDKMTQQLMDTSKDVLYDIFLDLPNEFDASDRDSCPEIV